MGWTSIEGEPFNYYFLTRYQDYDFKDLNVDILFVKPILGLVENEVFLILTTTMILSYIYMTNYNLINTTRKILLK